MSGNYAQFLKKLSGYISNLRMRIVTEMVFVKVFYLIELIFLKMVFVIISFPYFLFLKPKITKTKNIQASTASPERFQQVLVLSFAVIIALVIGLRALSASLFSQSETFNGAAGAVPQFSGSREYSEGVPLVIQSVSVSPADNTVTFSGTGPMFSHVALFIDNGESMVATTKVNAEGTWRLVQTSNQGIFTEGPHSVFAVFYGDDNEILSQPSPMKTFEIHSSSLPVLFKYFGFDSFITALFALGFLCLSIVRLKKTALT